MNQSAESKVPLDDKYAGKVVLIVNVASECGHTKQYEGLEQLHEQFSGQGLAVVGFPCNQFGRQEPGTHEQILEFCQSTFGVKFDIADKIDVNGPSASQPFKSLTADNAPISDTGDVEWNFEKFLVGRDGKLISRYRSAVEPAEIAPDIQAAL
ncbi:MAG: glutathione peroxidase [Planctomycetaceae bacterium]|nr:glutathione peroxidase [Planctomycetaceae bacterium]